MVHTHLHEHHFRTINHLLLIILLFLSGYIMFMPFVPEVAAIYAQLTDKTHGYRYQSALARTYGRQDDVAVEALKPIPDHNVLVIPQIGVDSLIVEGSGPEMLDQGLWRRPHTSTPDKGGNTVITGHRFMYTTGPKTLYRLDRIRTGDKFFVFWGGKEYDYEVTDVFVVDPGQVEIEEPTPEPILTLYTCTPLWTASQRLVVRARLIN